MLFYSQIINAEVRGQSDEIGGKIKDIVIKAEKEREFPLIDGFVVLSRDGNRNYISIDSVESLGKERVTLKEDYKECCHPIPTDKRYIFLGKTVIDRQIVDLKGVKVVRVNDLDFSLVQERMSLVAIEVGIHGLLRRLGFNNFNFFGLFKPIFIEWKHVHIVGDQVQISAGIEHLIKLHPADIADVVEKLNLNQGRLLLQSMDADTASRVFKEIEPKIQKILRQHLGVEKTAEIIKKMTNNG